MIYTVPTYLQFTSPGALPYDSRVLPVPVPQVRPRAGHPAGSVTGTIAELREVVARRIPVDRIFTDDEQLDLLTLASSGHRRDLGVGCGPGRVHRVPGAGSAAGGPVRRDPANTA